MALTLLEEESSWIGAGPWNCDFRIVRIKHQYYVQRKKKFLFFFSKWSIVMSFKERYWFDSTFEAKRAIEQIRREDKLKKEFEIIEYV